MKTGSTLNNTLIKKFCLGLGLFLLAASVASAPFSGGFEGLLAVSYTHLFLNFINLKLFRMTKMLEHLAIFIGYCNFHFLFSLSFGFLFAQDIIPVSYTHLDVYKRQPQHLRRSIFKKHAFI